jgi:RecB family exonuclease
VSDGVRFRVVREVEAMETVPRVDVDDLEVRHEHQDRPRAAVTAGPTVASLSYTALAAYQRCAYRFYVERVLGLPPTEGGGPPGADEVVSRAGAPVLSATERGTVVHALLERLDFRRPVMPSSSAIIAAAPRPPSAGELDAITALIERFAETELCARLGRAKWMRREQRFGFLFEGALISGMLDVIAGEPDDHLLIVDYKTDRLDGAEPHAVARREYATQQLIYALAALRSGATQVEVTHVFLEVPGQPVSATFRAERAAGLEQALSDLTQGLLQEESFPVSDSPHRELCRGCPAEGGLCSWPLEMTRRSSPEQLF